MSSSARPVRSRGKNRGINRGNSKSSSVTRIISQTGVRNSA